MKIVLSWWKQNYTLQKKQTNKQTKKNKQTNKQKKAVSF